MKLTLDITVYGLPDIHTVEDKRAIDTFLKTEIKKTIFTIRSKMNGRKPPKVHTRIKMKQDHQIPRKTRSGKKLPPTPLPSKNDNFGNK
jgi:hypothetical protein